MVRAHNNSNQAGAIATINMSSLMNANLPTLNSLYTMYSCCLVEKYTFPDASVLDPRVRARRARGFVCESADGAALTGFPLRNHKAPAGILVFLL